MEVTKYIIEEEKIDFTTPCWRGKFYKQLETLSPPEDYCSRVIQGKGKTLKNIIKEGFNWKNGDLLNGINSVKISSWDISISDLNIEITEEWDGLMVYKKKVYGGKFPDFIIKY